MYIYNFLSININIFIFYLCKNKFKLILLFIEKNVINIKKK